MNRQSFFCAMTGGFLVILSGCMMVTGSPRIEGRTGIRPAADTAVAHDRCMELALTTSAFQDGLHVRQEEYMEERVLGSLLSRAFRKAGFEVNRGAVSSPDAVRLFVQAEEDRTGPIGMRILSSMTFRVIPGWESIAFRVQAEGVWQGRPLPRFEFEADSVLVENVLLLPVAPFFSPVWKRRNLRREAVDALVTHVRACLAGEPQRSEETRP